MSCVNGSGLAFDRSRQECIPRLVSDAACLPSLFTGERVERLAWGTSCVLEAGGGQFADLPLQPRAMVEPQPNTVLHQELTNTVPGSGESTTHFNPVNRT